MPGPAWTSTSVLFEAMSLGLVLVVWATVTGSRLRWDLSHGGVGPNIISRCVWSYLFGLLVGLVGWTTVYWALARQYALSKWSGNNLVRLIDHECGTQQMLATSNTAANEALILLIGGITIMAISLFLMERPRRHLQTVAGLLAQSR